MPKKTKRTVGAPVVVDVAVAEPLPVRAKRESGPDKPRGLVDDFGTRPAGVTHWRCYRVSEDGTRSMLEFESTTTEMGVSRFPIAELAPSTIRKRWGAGMYKVEFLGPRAGKGTCIHLSWGQNVTIGERARRPSPEAVPAAIAPPAPSIDPFAMMNLARQTAREEADHIRARVNQDLTGLAQLAAVLAGNNQASAQLIAQQQQQQQSAAIATVLTGIVERLDRIEASDDEDDEDEDEEEDEDEDEEEGEEEEDDLLTKGLKIFEKYGPAIQAAMVFLSKNPNAIPNAATNGTTAAGVQVSEPQPTNAT